MRPLLFLVLFASILSVNTQAQVKLYASGGPEIIFSMADVNDQGASGTNILRFAPWFNLQINGNVDFGKHIGVFFGGAIRNVGFIYQYSDSTDGAYNTVKKKYRTYNFAIPLGIKLGVMNSWLFYGGYEFEFPLHYKEKTFINGSKQNTIISEWTSPQVPSYYGAAFVGVQFPYGFSLKFKYYLTEFFNPDYTAADGSQPYQSMNANVWYFSLNFGLFRNAKAIYDKEYRDNYY